MFVSKSVSFLVLFPIFSVNVFICFLYALLSQIFSLTCGYVSHFFPYPNICQTLFVRFSWHVKHLNRAISIRLFRQLGNSLLSTPWVCSLTTKIHARLLPISSRKLYLTSFSLKGVIFDVNI